MISSCFYRYNVVILSVFYHRLIHPPVRTVTKDSDIRITFPAHKLALHAKPFVPCR